MFHDVLKTANSDSEVVFIVKNTIVASIAWRYTAKSTTVNTIFEAFSTSVSSFIGVTKFALMADWGAKSPTTCLLVKLGKSTGFIGSPAVVALGGYTGSTGTETTDENFMEYAIFGAHIEISNKK